MKKRDIFLDFTSLLDVTLIIIFFFVLFSHLESEENKAATEDAVAKLEQEIVIAETREREAEELAIQLQEALDVVKSSDERNGENIEALVDYIMGTNLKMYLDVESSRNWKIRIVKGKEVLCTVNQSDDIANEIIYIFQQNGYTKEDTILCELVFDATVPGSASASRMTEKVLSQIKEEYKYLFVSKTDTSIGEE